MNLVELAERCEAASAADRELDARIKCALDGKAWEEGPYVDMQPDCDDDPTGETLTLHITRAGLMRQSRIDGSPAYTASLDAAMSLVPEGWKLRQMNFSAPCADDRKWHLNMHGGSEGQDCFVGRGSTQVLALVAAALRARATQKPSVSEIAGWVQRATLEKE